MSTYTRWYTTGVASATVNSTAVTGTDTYWKTAGLNPGDMITFDNGDSFFEIKTINSDTSITLGSKFTKSTVTGHAYAIIRNFTASTPAQLAAQAAELMNDFRVYVDTDMQKIQGLSAYEIAVKHGYQGTEAQWLGSLEANGKIQEFQTKFDAFYPSFSKEGRNSLVRYNYSLGSEFTPAQQAAIAEGSFDGMYLGSRWYLGEHNYGRIIGFNHFTMVQNMAVGDNNHWLNIGNHAVVELWCYNSDEWMFGPYRKDENCYEVGLKGMYIYTDVMPHFLELAENFFGADHIQSMRTQIADALASNAVPSHFTVTEDKIFMFTPSQITGTPYGMESSMYGKTMKRQFPLYRYRLPSQGDYTSSVDFGTAAIAPGTLNLYAANHNYDDFSTANNRNTLYKFYVLVK